MNADFVDISELRERMTEHVEAASGDRRHTWMDAVRILDDTPKMCCEACSYGKSNHTLTPTFWCNKLSNSMYPDDFCSRWTARAEKP